MQNCTKNSQPVPGCGIHGPIYPRKQCKHVGTCYKPADRLDSISTTQQQVIQRKTQNTLTLGPGGR